MMACGHSFSEKTGITHGQVQLLQIVQQNNGIGMKEIAKTLGISCSAATHLSCKIIENIKKKKSKIVNNGGLRRTYKV